MPTKFVPSVFSLALADWLTSQGFDPFDEEAYWSGGDLIDAITEELAQLKPSHLRDYRFEHAYLEAEKKSK